MNFLCKIPPTRSQLFRIKNDHTIINLPSFWQHCHRISFLSLTHTDAADLNQHHYQLKPVHTGLFFRLIFFLLLVIGDTFLHTGPSDGDKNLRQPGQPNTKLIREGSRLIHLGFGTWISALSRTTLRLGALSAPRTPPHFWRRTLSSFRKVEQPRNGHGEFTTDCANGTVSRSDNRRNRFRINTPSRNHFKTYFSTKN